MKKVVLVCAGFLLGFVSILLVESENLADDLVTAYRYYRIHGPKGLHAVEDYVVFHPIATAGILLEICAILYIIKLHFELEKEKEVLYKKGYIDEIYET